MKNTHADIRFSHALASANLYGIKKENKGSLRIPSPILIHDCLPEHTLQRKATS